MKRGKCNVLWSMMSKPTEHKRFRNLIAFSANTKEDEKYINDEGPLKLTMMPPCALITSYKPPMLSLASFFIIYLRFVRAESERKKSNWSVKDISMGATLAVSGFLLSNWKLLFSFSIQARDLTFNEVSLGFNSISPSTLPTQKNKTNRFAPRCGLSSFQKGETRSDEA